MHTALPTHVRATSPAGSLLATLSEQAWRTVLVECGSDELSGRTHPLLDVLAHTPPFSALPRATLHNLAAAMRRSPLCFKQGDVLVRAGPWNPLPCLPCLPPFCIYIKALHNKDTLHIFLIISCFVCKFRITFNI